MSKYEINLYELFIKYMDFLRENPALDVSAFYDKYKIFLKDEKNIVSDFFDKNIHLSTFESFDVNKFLEFVKDWYISIKTILRQIKETKDPYLADEDFLDNILRSLGISQVDQLHPEIKPDFSLDVVNLYKKKGTIESISKILTYYYLTPNEIFEFWLTKEPSGYWLVGKPRRANFVKNTPFDFEQRLPLQVISEKDPHWYYTTRQLDELTKNNKLSLPSLTPYIKVVLSRDTQSYLYQYLQLERTAHYIYNYIINGGDPEHHRWLHLEQFGSNLSILEVILGYSYLFNKRYNRDFLNDRNGRYLYSNVNPPADFVAQYDENDIRTRKFEYDYLKKIWEEFTVRPLLKNETCSEHGDIKEDDSDHIRPTKTTYRKLYLFNEVYESDGLNIIGYLTEPSIFYFNQTLFISGGQYEDGTWNNRIISVNGDKLSSVQYVPIVNIPINIKGHASFRHKESYYLFGGLDDSDNVVDQILEYNIYTNNWSIRPLNINRHNFKFFRMSEDIIVLLFGYNSSNNLVCDRITIYNITKGRIVDIDADFLKTKYITNYLDYSYPNNLFNYDFDYNQNNLLLLALYDQNVLLLIDIEKGLKKINTTSKKRIYNEISLPEELESLSNVKCFIDNSNRIFLVKDNFCYIYQNDKWSRYSFNIELPEIVNAIKIKTDRLKYYYLYGEENGSNSTKIQELSFEWVDQVDYTFDDNFCRLSDNEHIRGSSKILTFENFRHYSNRRALKEKIDTYQTLFTDKAPNYLYKDLFFDRIHDINSVQRLGIEEDEQKLLYDVDDISNFLDNIYPEYKQFLDRCLLLEEKDFNKLLIDLVSLMDLYIRLYWKDQSNLSSLVLTGNKNTINLVNEFKPIYTRYLGFATVINFKSDWSNSIYVDEKCLFLPVQYSSEYISIREDIALNPTISQILNDYYLPPGSYEYDYLAKDLWRREYHDIQLNVILDVLLRLIFKDVITILDMININITQYIVDVDSCLAKYNSEYKYDHSIKYCSGSLIWNDLCITRVVQYIPGDVILYKYNHMWLYDSTITYIEDPYQNTNMDIINVNECVKIIARDVNTGDEIYNYQVSDSRCI